VPISATNTSELRRQFLIRVFRAAWVERHLRVAIPFFIFISLLCMWALLPSAYASPVAVLPSQSTMSSQPKPQINRQSGGTLTLPELPARQGSNTREIPLPRIFRGCWSGIVPRVDSLEELDPESGGVQWLTKSYILCYAQIGAKQWKLTFAQGAVADRSRVSDERQRIQVKSVGGPNRARLVAFLHFRAPQVNALSGAVTGTVNTMDELTQLDCDVRPDGNHMRVRAQVYVENDGRPYAEISWHTDFIRQ
jgi:hypothetical protein